MRRRVVKIVDEKGVRPTASKVRVYFSMIGQDLNGVSFLDAFGGSGIMGLEVWSRGATPVLITEKNTRSVQQIRRQVQAFNTSISVQRIDAAKGMTGDWDVIFLDPPYRLDIHPYLTQALEVSAWIVIAETAVESPPNLAIVQSILDKKWLVCMEAKALWCIDDYDFSAEHFSIGFGRCPVINHVSKSLKISAWSKAKTGSDFTPNNACRASSPAVILTSVFDAISRFVKTTERLCCRLSLLGFEYT